MLTRKISKYSAIIFTILLAVLCAEILKKAIHGFKDFNSPYLSTLIIMAAMVLIYYPAYHFIKHLAEKFSKSYIRNTKKVFKSKFFGIFLAITVGFSAIYCIFLYLWFDINVLKMIGVV
ncbi:hypothetical protein OO013_12320 [Mangrovivirga sp. M17]|uniref:Uncharacterized protein n=1 Tax=Mangrovivirga halotolerans TaxID=2993936 RepID=A0ABT3RTI0_9BACT|nr:hypothetical protein [Mangrovivirga halotolerans]MCX2744658.1 hypothetical protein [Mangrovivirga halotolerans]